VGGLNSLRGSKRTGREQERRRSAHSIGGGRRFGGLVALAGTFKGLLIVLSTILLGASEGPDGRPRTSSFLLLWGGTEGVAAVFCLLGTAGAGLTISTGDYAISVQDLGAERLISSGTGPSLHNEPVLAAQQYALASKLRGGY
jgi:hypothetical protein